jgi:hypothetical protein
MGHLRWLCGGSCACIPNVTPQDYFRKKTPLPTELRTREFARLPLWIKEQSFFMAGVMRAEALNTFRQAAQGVIDGTVSEQEALRIIREGLKASGYKPEPGQEGTIKDLNSVHRQMINLRTNVSLAQGWAWDAKSRKNSDVFPARELVRGRRPEEPRLWQEKLWPEAIGPSGSGAKPEKMAALIDDPIWIYLSDFGTPYTPLKWGSGMNQLIVGIRDARKFGLLGPNETKKAQPAGSLNETLEVQTQITDQQAREELLGDLRGLGTFRENALVFTDPNGSRPWPVPMLAQLLGQMNIDATENYQKRALREWVALGGDSRAFAKMQEEFTGTDLLDDWNMLVRRVSRQENTTAAARIVGALLQLAELVL